ncbi:MAG: hypothetical protein JO189_02330, partial [Deltaproteobacteria bacterium]|nr:hypothetical protein [Deltaproteobacteria bacterium]
RLALLRAIREHEPESIYALAHSIDRDLKNVQDGLELLHKHGLVRFRRRATDHRGAKIPEVLLRGIEVTIALDDRETGGRGFLENNLPRFLAEAAITPSAARGEKKAV